MENFESGEIFIIEGLKHLKSLNFLFVDALLLSFLDKIF